MEARPIRREFRHELTSLLKINVNKIILRSVKLNTSRIFALLYMNIFCIYIYIFSIGGRRGARGSSAEIKRIKTRETRRYISFASLTTYKCI